MTGQQQIYPVLWSFRRCPFAMRARWAIAASRSRVWLREVLLRDKPNAFIAASPKATVPVLVLPDGAVIEESRDIMIWALQNSDPQGWLSVWQNDQAFCTRFL
jgi:glutathione S-transferase